MYAEVLQIIFFTISCKRIGASEHYSVTSNIHALIETHDNVVQRIQKYLQVQERRLKTLRRYLNLFKQDQENMKRDDKFVYNPINAYSLIHRLTEDLRVVKDGLWIDGERSMPKGLVLPVEEDLHGAALGLRRLQRTYLLNVTQLAAGIIRGTFSHDNKLFEARTSPMTLSAVLQLGRIMFEEGYYESALDWFHEALDKYHRRDIEDPYTGDASSITDYIRLASHEITDFKTAMEWHKTLMQLKSTQPDLYESMVLYHNQLKFNGNQKDHFDEDFESDDLNEEIKELCRGEKSMAEGKRKHLNCFYKIGPSPFLRLAPIKTELLYKDPDIYLFYDVISDAEIKFVQNMSLAQLGRSLVLESDAWTITQSRISKTSILPEDTEPTLERLSVRATDFTDLSVESAELLQVTNYGIAGHYTWHYDFLFPYEEGPDRIATVLYYMTDVEQGGATVFLYLNLTVFPVKNAAIFWSNLLPSGQPDYRMVHAGCPVFVGSKWIGNKWLCTAGQELIKPCDLEYQDNQALNYADVGMTQMEHLKRGIDDTGRTYEI